MTDKLPPDQGRAPQLYDEQLQRQQQEKLLRRRPEPAEPFLLAGGGDPARGSTGTQGR